METSYTANVEAVHGEIAGDGLWFSVEQLEGFLCRRVSDGVFPEQVHKEDLLLLFEKELAALRETQSSIEKKVLALRVGLSTHIEEYDEMLATEQFTEEGITVDSYLELNVIQARYLPQLGTEGQNCYFTVKKDGEAVYRSRNIEDINHLVWDETVCLPIHSKNHRISVEIHYETIEKPVATHSVELNGYSDQCLHSLWYDLDISRPFKAEIKVAGHWVHNLIKYHELNIKNHEVSIEVETADLGLIQAKLQKLLSYSGRELLQEWLFPGKQTLRTKKLSVLSFASTRLSMSEQSLESELNKLSESLTKVEVVSLRSVGKPLDFFAMGAFRLSQSRSRQ